MVTVFKHDGTLQCGLGAEISLDAMKGAIEELGAHVTKSEKRQHPAFFPQVCGARTGRCNVFELADDDWQKSAKAILGAGFELWPDRNEISIMGKSATDNEVLPWPWRQATGAPSTSQDSMSLTIGRIDPSVPLERLIGKRIRLYVEGDPITQDHRLDRANIVLASTDAAVKDIWFG